MSTKTSDKNEVSSRPCKVMPAILNACKSLPRSYGYLEKKTSSSRGSLHVLCKRLRDRGLLEVVETQAGVVKHQATEAGKASQPVR